LVSDRIEQVANTSPENIRANRYGQGDKHDQQSVFGRCGTAFVTVKVLEQVGHAGVLSKWASRQADRHRGGRAQYLLVGLIPGEKNRLTKIF